MFTTYPTYSKTRPLRLTAPLLKGEDVYALQCALNAIGPTKIKADGVLGVITAGEVKTYQTRRHLNADGIAGPLTQRQMSLDLAERVAANFKVKYVALKGQIEFESGAKPGIYSPLHDKGTDHESWDSGVVQENSLHHSVQRAFQPLDAIEDLAAAIGEAYNHFQGITNTTRRLQLAQGTWNAPAWACFIAWEEGAHDDWVRARKSKSLSSDERAIIEEYIGHVSVYYT